ncbi:MAG: hypothetical protein RMJ19_11640 [Gemmatales bacterium]|nr:hypothetical protein [Gemmatales bacterium]MDW8176317.1 hypothetical protein [Gemmatales bacterium]
MDGHQLSLSGSKITTVVITCMTWVMSTLFGFGILPAQENLPKGVVKTAEGYLHKPSGLELRVPKDWEVRVTEVTKMFPALVLRRRLPSGETIEATLVLSPLEELTLKDVVEQELKVLRLIYKDEKVLEPVEIKIPTEPPRPAYRFVLEEGPDLKGRQQGVVYLFTTSDEKKTWQVRLRATWNKTAKQALNEAENLLDQFRLHAPE